MTNNSLFSRGMVAVLVAQFLSALADNALLFAAIAMLREHQAHLILIGRTRLPERSEWARRASQSDATAERIRALQALEQLGGEIVYETADICDQERLAAAVAEHTGRWGGREDAYRVVEEALERCRKR